LAPESTDLNIFPVLVPAKQTPPPKEASERIDVALNKIPDWVQLAPLSVDRKTPPPDRLA
jgi:hypothetical protein